MRARSFCTSTRCSAQRTLLGVLPCLNFLLDFLGHRILAGGGTQNAFKKLENTRSGWALDDGEDESEMLQREPLNPIEVEDDVDDFDDIIVVHSPLSSGFHGDLTAPLTTKTSIKAMGSSEDDYTVHLPTVRDVYGFSLQRPTNEDLHCFTTFIDVQSDCFAHVAVNDGAVTANSEEQSRGQHQGLQSYPKPLTPSFQPRSSASCWNARAAWCLTGGARRRCSHPRFLVHCRRHGGIL